MGREVYGIIYKITNKVNGKVYIGQTIRKNGFKERYMAKGNGIERVYNYYSKKITENNSYNKHLYNSIEKYGFEAFDVIEEFDVAYSRDELDMLEIRYIKEYRSDEINKGYNVNRGGQGNKYGKSEYFNNIGKSVYPIYCKTTNEIYLSLAEASKYTGISEYIIKKNCENEKDSILDRKTNKYYNFQFITFDLFKNKPVACVNSGKIFKNPTDASKFYNVDRSCIIKCCNGDIKSAGKDTITGEKLIWKYAIEFKYEEI